MKEIIYLEIDEAITSAVDKIRKAEDNEVVLVMPKGATLLQSLINLKLLKKQSEKVEKNLSIVTNDKVGKTIAYQAGIPVYNHIDKDGTLEGIEEPKDIIIKESSEEKVDTASTIDDPLVSVDDEAKNKTKASLKKIYTPDEDNAGEEESEQEIVVGLTDDELAGKSFKIKKVPSISELEKDVSSDNPPKIRILRKRKILAVFLGIPFLAFSLGYIFIPKAEVYIKVKAENVPLDAQFKVDKEATRVDSSLKIIPGQFIDETVDEEKVFTATGKKQDGKKATGKVTLYNEWDGNPQTLVKGTRLRSGDGKIFRLLEEVTVPGSEPRQSEGQIVIVAGKISTDVEADEIGEDYNIGPSNFSIPAFTPQKQTKFYAKSVAAMTGGSTKEITIVSQEDADKAKEEFLVDLIKKYEEALVKNNPNHRLLKDALKIEAKEVKFSPPVGGEADKFTVKIKIVKRAVLFKGDDLDLLLKDLLKNEVEDKKEIHSTQIDEDKFVVQGVFASNFSQADFRFTADVDIIPKLDLDNIKKALRFRGVEVTKEDLMSYESVEEVKIEFWPFSMSHLPLISNNITVTVDVKK
jgi:hypothetical protein